MAIYSLSVGPILVPTQLVRDHLLRVSPVCRQPSLETARDDPETSCIQSPIRFKPSTIGTGLFVP